jgi:glycosyltransferase involved in cell wall biosynthesis
MLCVADVFPWPARDGYRIRLSQAIRALAEAGELDFFAAERSSVDTSAMPPDIELTRCEVALAPNMPVTRALLARMLASRLPKAVLARDWTLARQQLQHWAEPSYDLVWYSHAVTLAGLGRVTASAAVLDADNLEDVRLRSLRAAHLKGLRTVLALPHRSGNLAREVRPRVTGALSTFDARRWQRLQRRLSTQVDATLVCSELDKRRLGVRNAVVVPNGYDEPRRDANGPPRSNVMSMVGLFHYPPNYDAARFFVREVLPHVRAQIPNATVQFIGRHHGFLDDLGSVGGVVITGEVDDVVDELAGARVVIVPLRAGSGTRLKVLEAFACRIPVVSTSLGCEGLDVAPGRHLLVADRPEQFADACIRLLADDQLHQRITSEAWSLFESRYRWQDVRRLIRELVGSLTEGSGAVAGLRST